MPALKNSDTPTGESVPRVVDLFVCYRRDDASSAAGWLYSLLNGYSFSDRRGAPCKLNVYFDQAAPGVGDWTTQHEPRLQSAHAFIVVCSHGLATNFSKDGAKDWAHHEIDWWIENRNAPPILIDLTRDERWIPERIRNRWPRLNRLTLDGDALREAAPNSSNEFASRLRQRIVDSIAESEQATTYEELERTRKRNTQLKVAIAFAAVACVAALAGWLFASRAQKRADEQLKRAEVQREISRNSLRFLTHLFKGADPDGLFGDSLTARQLIKSAPSEIALESSPIVKAHLYRTIGSVYTALSDPESAIKSLRRSEDLFKGSELEGDDRFRLASSLGEAYLYSTDEFDKALPYLEQARGVADSAGLEKSDRAEISLLLGDYYAWSTPPQRDKALQYYQAALAIDRQERADPVAIARDFNRLGNLAHDTQNSSEARSNFQAALDTLQQLPADTGALLTAQYSHDFAATLYEDGVFADALERYEGASDSFKTAYGDQSVEFGVAANNIARMKIELDDLKGAMSSAETSVTIESEAEKADFSGLAFARNNRALTWRAAGRVAEAEGEFKKALDVAVANNMPITAQILVHLAEIAMSRNELERAESLLLCADDEFKKHEGASGWRYALYESAVGELDVRQCKLTPARELLSRSGAVLAVRWPKGNLFTRLAKSRNASLDTATCRSAPRRPARIG